MNNNYTFNFFLNSINQKRPIFTKHFIQRYVERIFNVNDGSYINSYIKSEHKKIYSDALKRILKSKKIKNLDPKLEQYLNDNYYGNFIYFKRNNIIFVTSLEAKGIKVITCFNGKDTQWLNENV